MFVILFMAQKGGVAKTTLLWNLAIMACLAGYRVCLIDFDEVQASLTRLVERRELNPWFQLLKTDFTDLRTKLTQAAADGFQYCFIDTAGEDNPAFSRIVELADFVVVPCGESDLDLASIESTLAILRRQNAPHAILPARVYHTETVGTREWRERMTLLAPTFETQMTELVCFKRSIDEGLSVAEYHSTGRAADEIMQTYLELKYALEGGN
jgi:chromosome partitioning protein